MARCLVTGGAGFIGSHLVEELLAQNHAVRILDDLSTGKEQNLAPFRADTELMRGSVTDPAMVERAVRKCEFVFHLAALPSVQRSVEDPVDTHEICVTGTLNVLNAARMGGVQRLVYAASSSAYGNAPGQVRREDEVLSPMSPYAAAKLAGEHYCQCFTSSYGLETVRLRFFNIFGPRQDASSPYSGVIALFIAAMLEGRAPTVYGDGLQSRDFAYVANAVQALIKAATAPAASGQVYNIGNGTSTSVLDLIEHLNHILGTSIEPVFAPARTGDVRYSQADISRAKHDLGYAPTVSLADGLRYTLEAQRAANQAR